MKILLVDDDSLCVETLVSVLKDQWGHDAYGLCFEGDEKALMAQVPSFDLLLMDIVMPRTWGTELTKMIRSNGLDIPIILMTGNNSLEFAIASMKSGADDLLFKPFGSVELNSSIKTVCQKSLQEVVRNSGERNCLGLHLQDTPHTQNSNLSGRKIERYKTRELLAELNYKDGKLDGVSKVYRKWGTILFEGSSRNGRADGSCICFDANGQVYIKDDHKEGARMERYIYGTYKQKIK